MKKILLIIAVLIGAVSCSGNKEISDVKPSLMWFDAEANFDRFSNPDSIDFYLKKIKDLGFTHAIVDVRPITGEVLYDSEFAPKMTSWLDGPVRPDFDYLGRFIETGHKLGLEIHASLNTFVAGHNYFDRGICYWTNPEWASQVYTPNGMMNIMDLKKKYSAMVNPIHPGYQEHILNVFKEVVRKYPELDGIMLDRVRYDGIMADFSDLSREKFEEYLGEKLERFPEDIYEWKTDADGKSTRVDGKHFIKWIEWRTKNIYDFMAKARAEVKSVNPEISFGTYTGAWYPSYYEVGVNFASNQYDPTKDFDWATPLTKNFGYAELLDMYATGNYYTNISMEDYLKNNDIVWNETDSQGQQGTWYCVEGSCQKLRGILGDNKFMGGILVDQFYSNPADLSRTIEMNLKESDGLMVFDIVHIITKNLWAEVEEGMIAGGSLKK